MMKYLCNEIPWERIKAVGFDMDGTIYDEYDFIYQVYQSIANTFSNSNHFCSRISFSIINSVGSSCSMCTFLYDHLYDHLDCHS